MAELGTSISKTQEAEPERRHRIASRAGDLLSSARLNARDSVRSKRLSKGDFGEPASCGWSVWREHSTLHHYMYMPWVIFEFINPWYQRYVCCTALMRPNQVETVLSVVYSLVPHDD